MDIAVTKKRIFNLISYDWLKIVAFSVAIVIVWSLLFTMLATRITDGQAFYLVVYEDVYTKAADSNDKFLRTLRSENSGDNANGVFSYDVLTTSVNKITSGGQYSASYMLSLRLTVHEGDILVIGGGRQAYDPSTNSMSDLQSLIGGRYIASIEKLLSSAYAYTVESGFIEESGSGYSVNESKIETYFREERIKSARNYKRTYTSEQKIKEGLAGEIKRIENIYTDYINITAAIEKAKSEDKDFLWYSQPVYTDSDGAVRYGEYGAYGIDLARLNEGTAEQNNIEDLWYTLDENGETTTEGLVMAVFDFAEYQPDLQYESLSVINYIIRTYSAYAD